MPAPRTPASAARPRTGSPGRPVTAREAQLLRAALAARHAPAGAGGTRTATRPATTRTTTRKTTRTAPTRTAPTRTAPTRTVAKRRRARRQELDVRHWSRRVGALALGAVVVPALATIALTAPAAPVAPAGPHQATSVALRAQTTLLQHAGRYRQLEQVVTQRRAELAQAEQARATARASVAAGRQLVGSSAAALYRSTPTGRFPLAGLDVAAPGRTPTVLAEQVLADRAGQERENAVVRAQRAQAQLRQADRRVAAAEAAVAQAGRDAAGALADTRHRIAALGTAVTAQLAALGDPSGAPTTDQQALTRWQDYLGSLASAGIQPPPAASLADPAHLPAGMSPARDAAGRTVPGVAWAVVGSHPVTVLPAETVAAVSAALSRLGRPFVAGATGPDTYDCGGFTAASWLLAGYALPVSPQAQWTAGTAVDPDDLQVGDLVVTDGGLDVGLYLGDRLVLGASAAGYRVTTRALPAVVHAVRVTLGAPATGNAALVPAAGMGSCGAALPKPGPVSPAWGGFANGRIPASSLCPLGVGGHELRCDAAAAYGAMSSAFAAAFGVPLCITDSYRSYASQLDAYERKPALAAWPGTSNHGWGLAVDLCGGINSAGTPQYEWMVANADRFGFVHPDWAQPTGEKPEPWHWEFGTFL